MLLIYRTIQDVFEDHNVNWFGMYSERWINKKESSFCSIAEMFFNGWKTRFGFNLLHLNHNIKYFLNPVALDWINFNLDYNKMWCVISASGSRSSNFGTMWIYESQAQRNVKLSLWALELFLPTIPLCHTRVGYWVNIKIIVCDGLEPKSTAGQVTCLLLGLRTSLDSSLNLLILYSGFARTVLFILGICILLSLLQ